MKMYYIEIENVKTRERKKHKALPVKTSIENIVKSFGNHGWITSTYHEVFNNKETIFVDTST